MMAKERCGGMRSEFKLGIIMIYLHALSEEMSSIDNW